nr:uncharacterized protein LOC103235440 isoform X3 [Chlorocebus sabaeus]
MAPVGRRRSASARRPGLQLPDAPAACQLASPSGGHLDRPVRGGRRSQGRQEEGTRRCPSAVQLGKGKPLMRDARPQGPTLMWAVTRAGRESCPATKATTLGAEQKLEIGKELDRGQAGSAEERKLKSLTVQDLVCATIVGPRVLSSSLEAQDKENISNRSM